MRRAARFGAQLAAVAVGLTALGGGRLAEAAVADRCGGAAGGGWEALLHAGQEALSQGRTADGHACLRLAQGRAAGNSAALTGVGMALAGAGGDPVAVKVCEAAQAAAVAAPGSDPEAEPGALLCLGLAHLARSEEADPAAGLALLRRAVDLRPDDSRLRHYLAEGLFLAVQHYARAGDHAAAVGAADAAVEHAPRPAWSSKVLKARGTSQRQLGLHREAAASFERALLAAPDDAELRANLGLLLGHLGDTAGAVAHLMKAVAQVPGFFEAQLHLAAALQKQFRHKEALDALGNALELDPRSPRAWAQKLQLQRELCLWGGLETAEERVAEDVRRQLEQGSLQRPSLTPFDALLTRSVPPELARKVAERYHVAAVAAAGVRAEDDRGGLTEAVTSSRIRRLRVGYLSSDFGESPVGRLVAGLPGWHRRGRLIESWMLPLRRGDASPPWHAFRDTSRNFIDLSELSHEESAARIRAERLDVLVDLMGFTAGPFALQRDLLVARRPAALTVGLVGFPGTAGAPDAVQYAVADRVLAPPSSVSAIFSEKLIYMPHTYQVNDYRRRAEERGRGAPGDSEADAEMMAPEIPTGAFAFAHFNSLRKVCPEAFGVWMNILRRVPGSVLWLLKMPAAAAANLRAEAAARGVAPERVVFGEPLPHELHLRRCARADLFLDSLQYGAHTTAADALWAGVPVLTLPGRAAAGRVAASLALAAGLPRSILAGSLREYEDTAVRLAREGAAPAPSTPAPPRHAAAAAAAAAASEEAERH